MDPMPSSTPKPQATPSGWSWDVLILLILGAGLLVTFQVVSMPLLASTIGQSWVGPQGYFELPWTRVDVVLLAGIAFTFLTLLGIEFSTGRVTAFFGWVFEKESRSRCCLLAFSLIAVRFYFSYGRLGIDGDAAHHVFHTWIAAESLRSGVWTVWTPILSVGTMFVQFYGWTFAYLSGLFAWAIGVETGLKLLLGLLHAISGLTCYLYVRSLTGSRSAGFLAGLTYVMTFWHIQLVMIMGRLPVALVFALLPLPFYCLEQLRREKSRRTVVLGALSVAALVFTHPGYGFWCVALLGVYLLIHALSSPSYPTRSAVASVLMGLLLSSCMTVPVLLEREWTGLHGGFPLALHHKPTWTHLLAWSNYRTRIVTLPAGREHWFGAYIGLSVLALTLLGYAYSRRRFVISPRRDFPIAGFLLSLLLTFGYGIPGIRDLPMQTAMGPDRFMVFGVFLLSVSAGIATHALNRIPWIPGGSFVYLLAILGVDQGSTTFIYVYHFGEDLRAVKETPAWMRRLLTANEQVDRRQFVSGRLLHSSKRMNTYLTMTSRSSTLHGLFEEHPRADRDFVRPFYKRLNRGLDLDEDYLSGSVGKTAFDGLRLLGVETYIYRRPGFRIVVELGPHSPITATNAVETLDHQEIDPYEMVNRMGFDMDSLRCDRILVEDPDLVASLPNRPFLKLSAHDVWIDRAEMSFELSADSYCRLAYGYYPWLNVTLDGEEASFFRTADGFIGMKIPSGRHRISLTAGLTRLRRVLVTLSLCMIAASLYWARRNGVPG